MTRQISIKKQIFGTALFALCFGVLFIFLDAPGLEAQSSGPVRVVQSDTSRIVLELAVAGYDTRVQRVEPGVYSAISIPGLGNTVEPGKPQLPTQGALVAIPPGAQASLKIIADDARTDSLANPPLPMSTERVQYNPRETLPTYAGASYRPDPATYSANRFYPADAAHITSTGDWRSQHFVAVSFSPLQYNPVTRQLVFHRRLRVEITLSYPRGRNAQTLGVAVNEGAFEQVLQQALVNYSAARAWRVPRASVSPARAPRYAGGPWYKVAVNADGIYKITCADLESKGVNKASLNPAQLQLFKQGVELAINVIGSTWTTTCGTGNYMEFFGLRATSKYTDTNVYWFTFGATTGKRMTVRDGGAGGATPTVFTETVHAEENHYNRSSIPWQDADHWFWNFLGQSQSFDYPFQINRLAGGSYSATLAVNFAGFSGPPYNAKLYINGASNFVADAIWSHDQVYTATFAFPQSYLVSGANTVRVLNSGAGPYLFINSFDIGYNATFTAVTDTLRFDKSGAWRYQIANFSNSTIKAFDVISPSNVAIFNNTTLTPAGPTFTLTFGDSTSGAHEYITLTDAQEKTPLSITLDTSANLSSTSNGADYIAISHGSFLANVQPLTDFRASQGMRVKLIDVQDVYDEFGDGLADPQAIRDFLAYAYQYWQAPAPAYVLLVGDGTFDPLGYCSGATACPQGAGYLVTPSNSTFIPPYLKFVDYYIGETGSDNRFVAFNSGNNLPNMAIGRLPANSPAEANAMVSKILSNEQTPPNGGWRGTFTFLTDNAYDTNGVLDGAGNFWTYSDEVASNSTLMPFNFLADRIYYNPCDSGTFPQCSLPYVPYPTPTSVRTAFFPSVNSGRIIVNYIGHAFITYWAGDQFFTTADVATFSNSGKPPMMLEMTCYTGYFFFNDPINTSLAEANVRAAGKGALASWSATGLGVATGHDYLHRGFYDALMQQNIRRIGLATLAGKQTLYTGTGTVHADLVDTFILLGDPASQLALQGFPVSNFYLPFVKK